MKRILALSVLIPALALADEAAAPAPAPTHTKVIGVILSTSQALVWDDEKGEYALRRVGETLDGARITALEADRVVVDRDGVRGEIELAGAPIKTPRRAKRMPAVIIGALPDGAQAPAAPVAAAPAAAPVAAAPVAAAPAAPAAPAPAPAAPLVVNVAPAAPPAPAPAAPPAPAPAPPPVVAAPAPPAAAPAPAQPQGEDDEVEATVIPRLDLDRELGNFDTLSRQAMVTQAQPGGFQLVAVRPGSFVSRVGLRTGDVILRIDGRPINKLEDAAAAYAWLRVTDRFTVDVLRSGQPMRLHYIIAPTAARATR